MESNVIKMPRTRPINLREALEDYIDGEIGPRRSGNTIKSYYNDLNMWLRSMSNNNFYTVTVDSLKKYYFETLAKKSISTKARIMASIKGFLGFCWKEGFIEENPAERIESLKKPDSLPKPLREDEVNKIFDKMTDLRSKSFFCLLYESGMRISEALYLDVGDVDLDTIDQETILVKNGKGGKQRQIPISLFAVHSIHWLKKYIRVTKITCGKIWRIRNGINGEKEVVAYRTMYYHWNKACSKAGIKARVHQLRHSCATRLVNANVPITIVQKLLGHRHLNTSLLYTEISPNYMATELKKAFKK